MKFAKSLTCLLLALAIAAGLAAFAEGSEALEPVTITLAVWDIPSMTESTDDFSDPNSPYYDPRWEIITDMFNVRVEFVPLGTRHYAIGVHECELS